MIGLLLELRMKRAHLSLQGTYGSLQCSNIRTDIDPGRAYALIDTTIRHLLSSNINQVAKDLMYPVIIETFRNWKLTHNHC